MAAAACPCLPALHTLFGFNNCFMPSLASDGIAADPPPAQGLWLLLVLLCAMLAIVGGGAFLGSTGLERMRALLHDPMAQQIVWDIRLPRSLGALAAGGLLGLAGCVAQGLFRNPLADPYLLGSASGAAFGVTVALVALGPASVAAQATWWQSLGVTGAAFIGAVGAVVLALLLAQGARSGLRLLLAGVVVGVVLGAGCQAFVWAYPDLLPNMQSFLLGTTSWIDWRACASMGIVWGLCALAAWGLSRGLDALALGPETARSLGLPLAAMQWGLIAVLALATGAAVAQTGVLAFVGLAAPHLVRQWVQVRHRQLVLLSSAMGAVLLGVSDALARSLWAPQELPVGIVTAVLGGLYLLWLMRKRPARPDGHTP